MITIIIGEFGITIPMLELGALVVLVTFALRSAWVAGGKERPDLP